MVHAKRRKICGGVKSDRNAEALSDAGGNKMISVTIATVPFIVACAIFLVFFFAISIENDGTALLPIVAIGVSVVIYFAIYGFAKTLHLF